MSEQELRDISAARHAWEEGPYSAFSARVPERKERFTTLSGLPVAPLYTPADVANQNYLRDVGFPGEYPYTRGPYPTMYRSRPWTMRQIAGFGTARDTNQRFKFLIAQGQTGISTDFDMIPELHWAYGYAWALGLMLVLSVGLWAVFRRIQWW